MFLVVVSIENLFYYVEKTSVSSKRNSEKVCTSSRTVIFIADIVSTVLRTYFPLSTMLILNILIILRLFKSKAILNDRSTNKENEFTRTVLLINFSFIVFNLQISIMYIVDNLYDHKLDENVAIQIEHNFYFELFYYLATFYYIVFFFLNLIFNKLFRYKVVFLLKLYCLKARNTRTSSSLSKF